MKKFMITTALAVGIAGTASAENIGVSMALFDDNFLTVLRNGMQDYAKTLPGVTLQVEDAQNDVGKQLNQIQNFIAGGVDAIIVNPVDTDATVALSQAAADAGAIWRQVLAVLSAYGAFLAVLCVAVWLRPRWW